MKKILFSLCFAAFLGAGLVSCTDEAAEIVPVNSMDSSAQYATDGDEPWTEGPKRPGS